MLLVVAAAVAAVGLATAGVVLLARDDTGSTSASRTTIRTPQATDAAAEPSPPSTAPETTDAVTLPPLTVPPATEPTASLTRFPESGPGCESDAIDPVLASGQWRLECIGAFALALDLYSTSTRFWVYRWTGSEWQDRGFFAGTCTSDLILSGLPNDFAKLFAFPLTENADCYSIALHPEPAVGALSFNDQGLRVAALQQRLAELRLLFDTVDGQYGPNTEAAVRDLQYLLGLTPSGVADGRVLEALDL